MRIDHGVWPEHLERAAAELESGCGCEDHDGLAGMPGDTFDAGMLDDGTIRYVLETRPHFEDLRHALGQVAGMLVLAAAGARTVTQDHPLFATARQTFARVGDGIRAARPSGRATHHHRHLLAALDALGAALGRAGEDLHLHGMGRERVDAVLRPLQSAYGHLAWATRVLPGYELVSFSQACCAPRQAAARH